LNEMLKKILDELELQTKILNGIFDHFDRNRHDSGLAKNQLSSQIDGLKKMIMQHQAVKENPELAALVNNALSPLIKGGGQ